jgi:excisionase family DNA binding protein
MQEVAQSTIAKRPRMDTATYSLNEVASLCGLGYTTLWGMVRSGAFPVEPIRLGRQYRFSKRAIDRLLDLEDDGPPNRA